jgi:predicted nucleotidyltransferase
LNKPYFDQYNISFPLEQSTICITLSGSHAYGTSTEASDTDYKGIFIPPIEYIVSPHWNTEQYIYRSPDFTEPVSEIAGTKENLWEATIFNFQKAFGLLLKSNPNILEILFVDQQHILESSPEYELLREHRDLFLSQQSLYAFCGYANSQLKRIKTHKKWIMNPPRSEPARKDFGLPEERLITTDQFNAALAYLDTQLNNIAPWLIGKDQLDRNLLWESISKILALNMTPPQMKAETEDAIAYSIGFDSNFIEYLRAEDAYAKAVTNWKQYQAWLVNRNKARSELESKYGFDTKHAMHLVRLLRMGNEILVNKTFQVLRPDAEELLYIRNGNVSYEHIVEESERQIDAMFATIRAGKTSLPKEPDSDKTTNLYMEIMQMRLFAHTSIRLTPIFPGCLNE